MLSLGIMGAVLAAPLAAGGGAVAEAGQVATQGALWSRAGPTVAAGVLAGARTPAGQQFIRNAHATLSRGPAGLPDPAAGLQRLTDATVIQLTTHPEIATKVLSRDEQMLPRLFSHLGPTMFGRALERLVAIDARTRYGHLLEYVGQKPGPDFNGVGPAAGRIFDITTYLQQAAHYARPYGAQLELILYEAPKQWP